MFDAMAMIFARRVLDGVLIGVQRHVEGFVANGVNAAAQPGIVTYLDGMIQLILLNPDDAMVVLVVFVRLVETSIPSGDPAVDAHLDPADA
jgi:hypothetical protein